MNNKRCSNGKLHGQEYESNLITYIYVFFAVKILLHVPTLINKSWPAVVLFHSLWKFIRVYKLVAYVFELCRSLSNFVAIEFIRKFFAFGILLWHLLFFFRFLFNFLALKKPEMSYIYITRAPRSNFLWRLLFFFWFLYKSSLR